MDMYQKRRMRQEKQNSSQEEKLTKVVINWEITTYEKLPIKAFNHISFYIL